MPEILDKYFYDSTGNKNLFTTPATNEQLINLENQLHISLPIDYKEFLKAKNGFEGFIRNYFVKFFPVEQIFKSTLMNCSEFFPWAIQIGSNGNVEMLVIDKRQTPYEFGLLPFIAEESDFIPLGNTFEKFIERLYNDTAYEKL